MLNMLVFAKKIVLSNNLFYYSYRHEIDLVSAATS